MHWNLRGAALIGNDNFMFKAHVVDYAPLTVDPSDNVSDVSRVNSVSCDEDATFHHKDTVVTEKTVLFQDNDGVEFVRFAPSGFVPVDIPR